MTSSFRALAAGFVDAGLLRFADVHTVALTAPRWGETDATRMLGLAFAVNAPCEGHAGVDLALVASRVDTDRLPSPRTDIHFGSDDPRRDAVLALEKARSELPWPDATSWHDWTLASPMVGSPEELDRPFVRQELEHGSLLLTRRVFRSQELVAHALLLRSRSPVAASSDPRRLDGVIARLFPDEPDGEAARAVRLVASRRLAILVGGPGTGKTFSITRVLAALLEVGPANGPLLIRLAAPTGKAAMRMREAIGEAVTAVSPRLDVPDDVRAALLALEATTVHRLIGARPDGSARHERGHPVPADVVVVDEMSMLDLDLMSRLVEAIPEHARLVLLGDRDQLASVEAGCVLADLVGEGPDGAFDSDVLTFTRSRRFEAAPDIALVAACLQRDSRGVDSTPATPRDRIRLAVDVMRGECHAANEEHPRERICWLGPPAIVGQSPCPTDAQLCALAAPYTGGFGLVGPGGDAVWRRGYADILRTHLRAPGEYSASLHEPKLQRAVLRAFESYRVLTVHRRGPLGVAGLDGALARRIREFLASAGCSPAERHWIGRPLLVTENAYDVGLMNGDVGLVLPTANGPAAVFACEQPDAVRVVPFSRLPPHESAFVMTVHKAQGSQFERVAVVLAGRRSPIQTRELLYTAITRAQNQLAWLGSAEELDEALHRRVERASGVGALLRQCSGSRSV
jgi:exodeoxyribonuclease V alpha subunit